MRMIIALTLGSCAALTKGDTGSIHPTGGSANSLASPPPLDSLYTASVIPSVIDSFIHFLVGVRLIYKLWCRSGRALRPSFPSSVLLGRSLTSVGSALRR